ncbi:MAG: 1-acyl-sn-glycerol-3-phosphate acyltransferase [Deltaproteobacteria bacterium]|nr:1-acyl-sn-glycerol-3-phosphate acyltransferase [Deltaproteobacteria bacterium]
MRTLYYFSLVFYLPPLLHLLVRFLRIVFRIFQLLAVYPFRLFVLKRFPALQSAKGKKLGRAIIGAANSAVGMMEYYVRAPRNYTFGFAYFILSAWFLLSAAIGGHSLNPATKGFPFLFVLLTFYSIQKEARTALNMSEFLRANPQMHPSVFFKTYAQRLGPFDLPFPDPLQALRVEPREVSFRKDVRPEQTRRLFIPVVWDTAHLAHACLKSLKYVGKEYAREVFDLMAQMWGKRTLQLFRASLTVTGAEKLQNLDGKILLVLNHKSQLDFALTFFALSGIKLGGRPALERGIRTRFITAKDHFVDNFFVYEILGVGKLIEAVDMVFIERKRGGKGIQNLKQAAEFLAQKEIDIAIFPQGTRAEGNVDRSGKRRDAGYYTTVSPKDIASDLAHLRKGTAWLAVDSLIELAPKGLARRTTSEDLHLVFVGISGTATALAKQSLLIQTETEIKYVIGEPLTLSPTLVAGCRKPEGPEPATPGEKKYLELVNWIHHEIDRRLSGCLEINEHLRHCFLLDLQGQLRYPPDRVNAVQRCFDALALEHPFIYQILDRIYASPLAEWNRYLAELARLVAEGAGEERLRQLRNEVTLKMMESLKAKVHGKRVKKNALKEAGKKIVNPPSLPLLD